MMNYKYWMTSICVGIILGLLAVLPTKVGYTRTEEIESNFLLQVFSRNYAILMDLEGDTIYSFDSKEEAVAYAENSMLQSFPKFKGIIKKIHYEDALIFKYEGTISYTDYKTVPMFEAIYETMHKLRFAKKDSP